MRPVTQSVIKDISKIFAEDSQDNILFKLVANKKVLEDLLRRLQRAKNNKGKNARADLTILMKTAYSTIMKVRAELIGSQNKISYRLYMQGENINDVIIKDLSEEEIMSIVERSGDTLRLKRNFNAIQNINTNAKAQRLFEQHFASVSKSLLEVKKGVIVVPSYDIQDVLNAPQGAPNLYWQSDNGRGTSAYTPKIFNRGWIYQAFDATIEDLYGNQDVSLEQKPISDMEFRFAYFSKHLAYDNLIAFKGGDVGLNQIKSDMASLISLTSLISYLQEIINLLNFNTYNNVEALTQRIKKLFTDTENIIEDNVDKIITQKAEELLKIVQTNLT